MLRLGLYRTPVFRLIKVQPWGIRLYSKSPFQVDYKKIQEERAREKLPKYKQWAQYFQTNTFKRKMTKYYVGMFGVLIVSFYYYMRDRWYEEQQLKHIKKKHQADPSSLSEYEYLKLKALTGERLKPREEKKFRIYQLMRKEFRRKHILETDVMFEPTPEDLDEWHSKQIRIRKVAVADEELDSEKSQQKTQEKTQNSLKNNENPHVVPPQDTTAFYEEKAAEYDDAIKWEERGVFMGRKRNWLMKQLEGDVLEVACGTGRNIPYLRPEDINSITYLDSSAKMVEETRKKFSEKFPLFKKVAYVTGRAEDLANLAKDDSVKYDTIVEAFGVCAHEDPVAALKNMLKLLRPGGRIVLLEHGRSNWDFINNHLDFRAEKRMKTWACRWNLDIGDIVDDAGLDITYEKRAHLGTTWMLVCKRPQDEYRTEEKSFMKKIFGVKKN